MSSNFLSIRPVWSVDVGQRDFPAGQGNDLVGLLGARRPGPDPPGPDGPVRYPEIDGQHGVALSFDKGLQVHSTDCATTPAPASSTFRAIFLNSARLAGADSIETGHRSPNMRPHLSILTDLLRDAGVSQQQAAEGLGHKSGSAVGMMLRGSEG